MISHNIIKKTGSFSTFAYLYQAAKNAFGKAKTKGKNCNFHILYAEIFSAFTLEAYLNHIGNMKIKSWNIVERKLSPAEKLILISTTLDISIDKSRRPFQNFNQLFRFRNFFAHGKTCYFDDEIIEPFNKETPKSSFEPEEIKSINFESVKRLLFDTKDMIEYMHRSVGLDMDSLWTIADEKSLRLVCA